MQNRGLKQGSHWPGKVREKNCVREFWFFKSRGGGEIGIFLKWRLPWKFAVILVDYRECTNMKVHMWVFKIFVCFQVLHISYGMSYFRHWDSSDIFTHTIWIGNQLSIKWSGKFLLKSGKSWANQGIFVQIFGRNPVKQLQFNPRRDLYTKCASWSEGRGFDSCVGFFHCGHIPVGAGAVAQR